MENSPVKSSIARPYQSRPERLGGAGKLKKNWSDKALSVVQKHADAIAQRLVKIALNDDHPGQLAAIKLCMERLVPATKAVDATGLAGKQVSIKISVEAADTFEKVVEAEDFEVVERV